jgi:hypothetical protein
VRVGLVLLVVEVRVGLTVDQFAPRANLGRNVSGEYICDIRRVNVESQPR